jgi:magnesium transporter
MSKRKRSHREPTPGAAPGTIVVQPGGNYTINVIGYTAEKSKTVPCRTFAEAKSVLKEFEVVWIDVVGPGNAKLLREFGDLFNIHNLTLEDVAHVTQRAKCETFKNYRYVVTRMLSLDEGGFDSEQISIFQSGKFVITFQERPGDCLQPLRTRIAEGQGIIRTRKSDYLVYAILDTVFDHYFPVIDWFGDHLDKLDEAITGNNAISLQEIHRLRSQLLELRRWLRPNRELLNQLIRDETEHVTDETRVFLRDCYDHIIQLQESIESYRELCSDLRDFHLASVGNRTNEVMKTLTIVSTIFIPLGFIAGLYGMNFDSMPELQWRYGYAAVLALMTGVTVGFLLWFRRKGWL